MPSNTTPNYQLNQWAADDQVQRVDFNADNAKVDAAIHAVAQKADSLSSGKAEQSALTAEVNTRTSQVNALNAKVAKLGNCEIYHTSYVGDGQQTKTLSFPQKPLFVFVMGAGFYLHAMAGAPLAMGSNACSAGSFSRVTWSGNTMSWTYSNSTYTSSIANDTGETYHVIALIDAAG